MGTHLYSNLAIFLLKIALALVQLPCDSLLHAFDSLLAAAQGLQGVLCQQQRWLSCSCSNVCVWLTTSAPGWQKEVLQQQDCLMHATDIIHSSIVVPNTQTYAVAVISRPLCLLGLEAFVL